MGTTQVFQIFSYIRCARYFTYTTDYFNQYQFFCFKYRIFRTNFWYWFFHKDNLGRGDKRVVTVPFRPDLQKPAKEQGEADTVDDVGLKAMSSLQKSEGEVGKTREYCNF